MRILLVDHSAVIRQAFPMMVADAFPTAAVLAFDTPRAAVDEHLREPADVFVLDARLPRVAPADAVATVRAAAPETPIIVASVLPRSREVRSTLAAGASAAVDKADAEAFLACLRSYAPGPTAA